MAKQINTSIIINATPGKVWSILTGFNHYSEWNPFIRSISGSPEPGQNITVRIEPPGAAGMTLKPKVLAFMANKEFRWKGNLIIPGLFDGEHSFILTDNGDGTTTFAQNEYFTGILIPLFTKMIEVNTVNGFKLMNEKLKMMAEKH
jgi:hypothetical protein